jgi:hypothetical protein
VAHTNDYMKEYMRNRRATVDGRAESHRTDQARQRAYTAKIAVLKDRPCELCGGVFPSYVMEFHHRDKKDKGFRLSSGHHKKWEEVIKEISKCDLLCSNCHAIVEYKERHSRIP